MESLFDKDPTQGPPPSNYQKIEKEIAHLKKKSSVRDNPGARPRRLASWFLTLVLCSLLGLYLMDPFIYALKKSDAIPTYLYLRSYGDKAAAEALAATKIFDPAELRALDQRQGNFVDYYASPQIAEAKANEIVAYINGLHNLREGKYEQLDSVGKLRCIIFVKNGINPPMYWTQMNSRIEE